MIEPARFKGSIIVGLILLFIAPYIILSQVQNKEENSVTIKKIAGEALSIDATKPEEKNNGRIVHLIGKLSSAETITVLGFIKSVPALKLTQTVEMLQWKEISEGTKGSNYRYELAWSNSIINSSKFHVKDERYKNPANMPMPKETFSVKNVTFEGYDGAQVLERLKPTKRLTLTKEMLDSQFSQIHDNYLYPRSGDIAKQNSAPGSIRIRYDYLEPEIYSVIARQVNTHFLEQYQKGRGMEIARGTQSIRAMTDTMGERKDQLGVIGKVIGFLIFFSGFYCILARLTFWTKTLPGLGELTSLSIIIVSAAAALGATLLFTVLGFLMVNPLMGGIVITAAVGLYIFMLKKRRRLIE